MSACVYFRIDCFKALCGLAALALLGTAPALAQSRTAALSPSDSLEQIELEAGYRLELLASEPMVVDPVEVAFDSSGRLWVVEMRDYPYRVAEQPQGTIRILSDRDGDGRFDHAHVFADNLEMPTGLAFWKDGVLVTLAGKLLFLRDTDGDLTADETQVWLDGFAQENEQLRANHPRLSPDGQWTIASGLRGGKVRLGSDWLIEASTAVSSSDQTATPAPLEIGSRDIRFDPRTGTIELITGPAQFGLCFDPFGQRYFCSNRNPAVKVIFEQEDLLGNPLAGLLPSVLDVVPAGEASQVFPLIDSWTTSNLHAGQFTAACGVLVRFIDANQRADEQAGKQAEDALLTSEIFMCEPTGSLVKRAVVGHHFRYESHVVPDPSSAGREWLASRDAWFRPVNVAHTPDGGVAIVDMHRAVIEHPAWVPDELKQRPDERWGDDAGRIYAVHSVVPIVHSVASSDDTLNAAAARRAVMAELQRQPLHLRSAAALAQHVVTGNPWFQENAARLLIERQATDIVPQLLQYAGDPALPLVGRVAAVRLVAALGQRSGSALPAEITQLLTAKMPAEVQTGALHVLRKSSEPRDTQVATVVTLLEQLDLNPLSGDAAAPQLAFEAWLALGELATRAPQALVVSERLLDQAALLGTRDPYQLVASASSLRDHPGALLARWIAALQDSPWEHAEARFPELQVVALASGLAAAELRNAEPNEALFLEMATQLTHATPHRQLAIATALEQLATRRPDLARRAIAGSTWDSLRQLADADNLSPALQGAAVELLSRSLRPDDLKFLGELAQATTDPRSKALYLNAWARQESSECDRLLLDLLRTGSPALQATALGLIVGHPTRTHLVLDELQQQRLTAQQLGAAALKSLTSRASGEVQRQLQSSYDELVNSDRQQVVKQYESCLQLEGDPQRGRQVFKTQCASCHRIGDTGISLGPDISDSRTQQPLQLLTSILNPNLAIDNNYFRYVILTVDDQIVEGMVAEETADAIVIRGPENRRTVVGRHEVAEFKATGVSMMPEGLETQIDPQAMADLITFIKGWRYLDGAVPGK